LVVGRVAAYRLDLPIAVSGVLLRVELVGRRRTAGETVVSGELLEHTRGGTVGAAVHRLDERKERDALERGAVLAPRPDHLARGAPELIDKSVVRHSSPTLFSCR